MKNIQFNKVKDGEIFVSNHENFLKLPASFSGISSNASRLSDGRHFEFDDKTIMKVVKSKSSRSNKMAKAYWTVELTGTTLEKQHAYTIYGYDFPRRFYHKKWAMRILDDLKDKGIPAQLVNNL